MVKHQNVGAGREKDNEFLCLEDQGKSDSSSH